MDNEELLAPTVQSEETIAPAAPAPAPTDAPATDNTALLNAYERTKARLKAEEEQNKKYKGLLEQLQPLLGSGNSNPGTNFNAAELLNTFSVQEKLEALKAEAAAAEGAKVRAETQQTIAAIKQEAESVKQRLSEERRNRALFDFFHANGGDPSEFSEFCALAGNLFEVDTTQAKVLKVRSPDGSPVYDDASNALDPVAYMDAVRRGRIGTKALRSTLTPYNQSSGVGTSPAGRTSDGVNVYRQEDMPNLLESWHREGKDAVAEIKKAKWI